MVSSITSGKRKRRQKKGTLQHKFPGHQCLAHMLFAVTAYIKLFHPSWSPAAIKFSMMTTTFPLSVATSPEAEFAYCVGHINPLKAVNPSLVYDSESIDYVKVLCGQGYSTKSLHLITGNNSTCFGVINETVWDLNLPSSARAPMALKSFSKTFKKDRHKCWTTIIHV